MIKVTWYFEKFYSNEDFSNKFSESNDVNKEGYYVIANDWDHVDSMDDMNLEYKLEKIPDEL